MVEKVAVAQGAAGSGLRADGMATGAYAQPTRAVGIGTVLVMLVITVGALVLRLYNVDRWGIWVDEFYSVQHAIELTQGMIDFRVLAWLPHLISFELVGVDMASLGERDIWTWYAAGITEWNMRAPIAALGALSVLVLGLASRRILGSSATLFLCLLIALSPWHLWMSQVCRFYVQLFLLYNLALLFYYRATDEDHVGYAVASMVCLVLSFYTSPITLMILGVFAVDLAANLARGRQTGMRPQFWAMGAVAVAVCGLGWLITRIDRPGSWNYATFQGTEQSIPVMTMGMVYLIGIAIVVTAALGFWVLGRRNERLAVLLAAASVVPLATFIAFNLLGKDTHVRYIFVALFPWLALAAVGMVEIVDALRPRVGGLMATVPALALISTFVLTDYIYLGSGAGYRGLWREAVTYVDNHRAEGELVAGDWTGHRMFQYYLGERDVVLLPLPPDGFPEDQLRELLPQPAWIVVRAVHPSSGDRSDQLRGAGTLQTYFANQVAQPYHAINVYRYTPAAAANPGVDRSGS